MSRSFSKISSYLLFVNQIIVIILICWAGCVVTSLAIKKNKTSKSESEFQTKSKFSKIKIQNLTQCSKYCSIGQRNIQEQAINFKASDEGVQYSTSALRLNTWRTLYTYGVPDRVKLL